MELGRDAHKKAATASRRPLAASLIFLCPYIVMFKFNVTLFLLFLTLDFNFILSVYSSMFISMSYNRSCWGATLEISIVTSFSLSPCLLITPFLSFTISYNHHLTYHSRYHNCSPLICITLIHSNNP